MEIFKYLSLHAELQTKLHIHVCEPLTDVLLENFLQKGRELKMSINAQKDCDTWYNTMYCEKSFFKIFFLLFGLKKGWELIQYVILNRTNM